MGNIFGDKLDQPLVNSLKNVIAREDFDSQMTKIIPDTVLHGLIELIRKPIHPRVFSILHGHQGNIKFIPSDILI